MADQKPDDKIILRPLMQQPLVSGIASKYGRTGAMVVVEACEVRHYSEKGYVVVDVVEDQQIDTFYDPGSPPSNSNGYVQGPTVPSRHVISKHKFVMALDVNSSLEIANREREEAVRLTAHWQEECQKAEKRTKEVAKISLEFEQRVGVAQRSHENCPTRIKQLLDANVKMERDIGKLRDAFGSVKVKEILEPSTEKKS